MLSPQLPPPEQIRAALTATNARLAVLTAKRAALEGIREELPAHSVFSYFQVLTGDVARDIQTNPFRDLLQALCTEADNEAAALGEQKKNLESMLPGGVLLARPRMV
jgi:hypothetical protein